MHVRPRRPAGEEKTMIDRLTTARTLILAAAFGSFLLSVSLWFSGHKEQGQFVGLWVPSILALGGFYFASRRRAQ
jgi:hypothetical protein